MQIHYDECYDVITIEGVNYAGSMFRELGGLMPINVSFKIVKRENGTLTISREDECKTSDSGVNPLPNPGIDDILQAAEDEYRMVMMETPELRQWAVATAVQAIDRNSNGSRSVLLEAQSYVDYVLRGQK